MAKFTPDEQFIRVCMLYEFLRKNSATTTTKNICALFGNRLDVRKCQRWFKRFRTGNFDLNNFPVNGRPTEVDDEALAAEIEANPTATARELSHKFGYTNSSTMRHIKRLGLIRENGVWVPQQLDEKIEMQENEESP